MSGLPVFSPSGWRDTSGVCNSTVAIVGQFGEVKNVRGDDGREGMMGRWGAAPPPPPPPAAPPPPPPKYIYSLPPAPHTQLKLGCAPPGDH